METDNSVFKIPGLGREKVSDFVPKNETSEIYAELNAINEEIEKCRSKNS